MSGLSYFVYSQFPGIWKGWSLAVLATGRRDADNYVRSWHHGGKFSHSVCIGGSVKTDCGGVTSAAQEILHEQFERWTNETE
jgi:hypothetical protein